MFSIQALADTCEDVLTRSTQTPSSPRANVVKLTSVDGVSVHFLFDLRLDTLNFSTRVKNVFEAMDFTYIGDIVEYSESDLLSIGNFGRVSLNEINNRLSGLGLRLNMSVGDWSPPVLASKEETNSIADIVQNTEQPISVETSSVSSLTKEETTSESETMGGGNPAISSTDVNNVGSLESGRSSLNSNSQREGVVTSEGHLIKIEESVFFTPEFNKWFNKKNNLHSMSKNKIMNAINHFERQGINGLGNRWSSLGGGLLKLVIASRNRGGSIIYFTVESDNLYLIFGDKVNGNVNESNRSVDKARQLIENLP